MPEQYREKRGLAPYMLSSAVKNGALVEARCTGCSPTRWYHPEDIITLYGDMPTMNLERIMHCEECSQTMRVEVTVPLPEERVKIRLRRIDRIWWTLRVRWREEGL